MILVPGLFVIFGAWKASRRGAGNDGESRSKPA